MMRFATSISVAVLALAALFISPVHATSPAAADPAGAPPECQASLDELTKDPNWYAQLINPVLNSQAEIDARAGLYSSVRDCLSRGDATIGLAEENADTLLEYFLVFAGGRETDRGASKLAMVMLGTSDDPAVRTLRDSIGIPAPAGFVYVRTYASREAMPAAVRAFFQNDLVQGVTVLNRYVAVLVQNPDAPTTLETKTISHELVHAYVSSASGAAALNAFPTWFAEGMAVHFSGSSEPSCVNYLSPARELMTQCGTATEEYAQYAQNFQFLEDALGTAGFAAAVRDSIQNHDAELIYKGLGIASYAQLVTRANQWHEERNTADAQRFIGGGLALIVLLAVLIMVVNWLRSKPVLWEREPAAEMPASTVSVKPPVSKTPARARPMPANVEQAARTMRPVTALSPEIAAKLGARVPPRTAAPASKPLPEAAVPRVAPPIAKPVPEAVGQPTPPVSEEPLAEAPAQWPAPAPVTTAARPPKTFSAEEIARVNAFWESLPNFPQLLGSEHRLQVVMKTRAQPGQTGWHLDYECPNCSRQSVMHLPNDLSYEQYAEGIRDLAKAKGKQPPPEEVIERPYAICLYCGMIFWGNRLGVLRAPLPIRRT